MTSPAFTVFPGQDLLTLDRTHRESREVIVVAVIHARHFGGFAADQGAARLLAAIGNARDHLARGCYVQFPRGVIIKEEQRFSALYNQIVHRHGDEVDADVVVAARSRWRCGA